MAKHNKEELEILGGKATKYTNDYGVWQFRLQLTTDNKYVRKSLRTKVKDYAITEGEKPYIQIRSDIEKGIKYFAITVKEAAEAIKDVKDMIAKFSIAKGDLRGATMSILNGKKRKKQKRKYKILK